jgi:hypothetical protein
VSNIKSLSSGDLFERVKSILHYEYISDLRDLNRNIENDLDLVLLQLDPASFEAFQWRAFIHYLFPNVQIDPSATSSQLRNSLVLAIYEYKQMRNQIERLKMSHYLH